MKLYILDASGLINGFYSKDSLNLMTSSTVNEIKDINTEMLLNNCINEGFIKIEDVDYSNDDVQNTLKLLNLKFKSVRTKGIKNTIQWKKICKGCRKEYPSDTSLEECDICGSPIIRKRMNAHSNF